MSQRGIEELTFFLFLRDFGWGAWMSSSGTARLLEPWFTAAEPLERVVEQVVREVEGVGGAGSGSALEVVSWVSV